VTESLITCNLIRNVNEKYSIADKIEWAAEFLILDLKTAWIITQISAVAAFYTP